MDDCILELKNIKKSFGGVKALKGVSLELRKGEIHCLAGENGCGKSTLIKVASGVYTPDEGEICINGKKHEKVTPHQAIAEGIQVIYQDFAIFPNLTVMENLALTTELAGNKKIASKKWFKQIALESIQEIGFDIDLNELVENLSVADKQLIAISRAFYHNAKLIIMDEPTTALTDKEVKSLFRVIKNLQSQGMSILFVSHKLDEVFEISERYTILRNGENVSTGDVKTLDEKQFSFYMTGREFANIERAPEPDKNEVVMEVQNLTLANGYKDISFQLYKGEILGMTGLLGSGRTELMESIFGYRRADSGKIIIDGTPVEIKSVNDAMDHGIGYVPEDRLIEGLFLDQSIEENISVAKWDNLTNRFMLDKKAMGELAQGGVDQFHIVTDDVKKTVQKLSGGNQQKVVLARWLARDLKVLILNGPTVGVDIGAKYDIHGIIRALAKKGMAVIVISDDLPEILENCNRVLIMNAGMIKGELVPSETDQTELTSLIMGG